MSTKNNQHYIFGKDENGFPRVIANSKVAKSHICFRCGQTGHSANGHIPLFVKNDVIRDNKEIEYKDRHGQTWKFTEYKQESTAEIEASRWCRHFACPFHPDGKQIWLQFNLTEELAKNYNLTPGKHSVRLDVRFSNAYSRSEIQWDLWLISNLVKCNGLIKKLEDSCKQKDNTLWTRGKVVETKKTVCLLD